MAMSTTAVPPTAPGPELDSLLLVSADSHVTMPDSAWPEYLDPHFTARAPRIEVADDGVYRVFEGSRRRLGPHETLGLQAGRRPNQFGDTAVLAEPQESGACDPRRRLADQDADHVCAEILYFGGPLTDAADAALRLNSYRAYNRWLADFCSVAPDRLVGAAAVPADSPDAALAELDAAIAMGFRTVYLPLFPPGGSFADPEWDPLWARLADAGMPAGLHIGDLRHGPRRFDRAGIFMTQNLMARMLMAEALGELVMSGVLQRHRELTVVSVEAQVGWLSFAISHLDTVWEKHRHWSNSPLTEPPSLTFARQVHATFTVDPVGLREARHIGLGSLMWSSDYPHAETLWPDSKPAALEAMAAFDAAETRALLYDNAAALYGLS